MLLCVQVWVLRILPLLVFGGFAQATEAVPEQAIGFYSDGQLINPSQLPDESDSFVKIFRPRDRAWTSFDFMTLIAEAATEIHKTAPELERLQVGDLSNRAGGQAGGHASHQNGLDGDLVYYRNNRVEQPPENVAGFEESFVINKKVTENFDLLRNWRLISLLVDTGRIKRIFVDSAIKKAFCEHARAEGLDAAATERLRRLRPLVLHDDHMHVRVTCPLASPRCIEQADPAIGDGCSERELMSTEWDWGDFE